MHDFRAKLSDPRVAGIVENYLARVRQRKTALEPCGEPYLHGPVSINLDLTLACDHRCGHCIDAELLNGGRRLAPDQVRSTLEVLASRGLRSVILIGGGEPTLHPAFEDVVATIKRLGLECAIVTNGTHNDRIARVASLLGPRDWIRLSLDAGTEATFQILHRPRKPVTLEEICRSAAALKRDCMAQLGFSFVVMWNGPGQMLPPAAENVEEMPVAAALAKQYGFDYISFKPMLARDANRAEVVNAGREETPAEGIRESLHAAQEVADAGFRVVPSRNLIALLEGRGFERSGLQPRKCHMQRFRQVVTPVHVFSCPAHRGNPNARLADAAGYTTPEAFERTMRATDEQIDRFDASVECSAITCIYNDANWWLEELAASGQPVLQSVASDLFL